MRDGGRVEKERRTVMIMTMCVKAKIAICSNIEIGKLVGRREWIVIDVTAMRDAMMMILKLKMERTAVAKHVIGIIMGRLRFIIIIPRVVLGSLTSTECNIKHMKLGSSDLNGDIV